MNIEFDIDRRAHRLVREFGIFAPASARFRAAAYEARNDADESAAWRAVEDTVCRLLRNDPGAPPTTPHA